MSEKKREEGKEDLEKKTAMLRKYLAYKPTVNKRLPMLFRESLYKIACILRLSNNIEAARNVCINAGKQI
jgi:hypothetical protein